MDPAPTVKDSFWQPLVRIVDVATTPGGPLTWLQDLVAATVITWFAVSTGVLHYTLGRILYALFITFLALSFLGSIRHHLVLWARWWRIRRQRRAVR